MDWNALGSQVLGLVLTVITPLLGVLAVWIAHRIAKKIGIQLSEADDRQVQEVANTVAAAVDEWKRKQAIKPTGNQLTDVALQMARELLDSGVWKRMGADAIKVRLEAAVNEREDPELRSDPLYVKLQRLQPSPETAPERTVAGPAGGG
jgi:hypothetical protein